MWYCWWTWLFILFLIQCINFKSPFAFRSQIASRPLTKLSSQSFTSKWRVNSKNFIANIIEDDIASSKAPVVTRFPPEPNGYLHLGHAKSIYLNFGIASKYNGTTIMRFDDTNPEKEDSKYIHAILEDVRWLLAHNASYDSDPWQGKVRYTSDYFDTFYKAATYLIKNNLAYVDSLSQDELKQYRGTLTEPGKDSPYRNRSIEENLKLFESMKNGEFEEGHCVLRAKIDNSSPNINMRDPTLYRIKYSEHPLTRNAWCVYPMYDFAHTISDALEGISHSLCTLEFEDHRPLYEWILEKLSASNLLPNISKIKPKQIEFSRLNIENVVLSKRKLIQLVKEGRVEGWDDPRMPTICGMRRRGYPPEAIRLFCDRIGVSKAESIIEMSVLEDCARESLENSSKRAFAVVEPMKITISNIDANYVKQISVPYHPKRPELGSRDMPFTKQVYINRDDFFDTGVRGDILPPKGFKRLTPGGTLRLKNAYIVKCDSVIRNEIGEAVELICSADMETLGGLASTTLVKPKGIVQWVSVQHAFPAEIRLYDRLFSASQPGKSQIDGDFIKDLNLRSIVTYPEAVIEPAFAHARAAEAFQFERMGYFCIDPDLANSLRTKKIVHRITTIKDKYIST